MTEARQRKCLLRS